MGDGMDKETSLDHVHGKEPLTLWVVGKANKHDRHKWEFMGVFESRQDAETICTNDQFFVGPAKLNEKTSDDVIDWPEAYYPKRNKCTPLLQRLLSNIVGEWSNDQLYESFIALIYTTEDERLEEYFETELEEVGYDFDKHQLKRGVI